MKRRSFLKNSAILGAVAVFGGTLNLSANSQNHTLNLPNLKKGTKMENYLFEIARKRRSIRTYTQKAIDKNILDEIMKIALCAPSSFGYKPVEFVLVRDKSMIRQIGQCKTLGGSQINSADTVIVVMVKTQNDKAAEFWIEDGAVASAYILLGAEQYGLGACWVQIRNRTGQKSTSDEEIRTLLKVPSGYTVLNLVALGEKNEYKEPYTLNDLPTQNLHYEVF